MDVIVDYFKTHWPLTTFIIGLVVVAIIATWWAAKKYHHWTGIIKNSENDCAHMRNHISPQLSTINQSISGVATSVNNILIYLKGKDNQMDTSLFVSKSPFQITPVGMEILQKMGAIAFIEKNIETLFSQLDAIGINTALDLQNVSPGIISNLANSNDFKIIKDFVYKHPIYKIYEGDKIKGEIPLDMNTVTFIMGLYLRNLYLEKHPEIKPD